MTDRIIVSPRVNKVILRTGTRGAAGATGPAGPPGSGGDLTYVHDQPIAADTWVIVHNLAKRPAVTCLSVAGKELGAVIVHDTVNQCTATFSEPVNGSATCN